MREEFLEINESLKILDNISIPWFVCGGWAIDLFLNRKTREHSDLEIGIYRKDQKVIQDHLYDFKFYNIQSGEKFLWIPNEFLKLPIHEIWAEKENERLEILLNESHEKVWIYRRNPKIELPISKAILSSETGLNFLAPEIVLLYKSKNFRPKDQKDFDSTLPYLNVEQKTWLRESLQITDPEHIWIEKIIKSFFNK